MSGPLTFVKWDFSVLKEDWSRFLVNDGTQLKIRIVIVDMFRSVQLSPTGYPNMTVSSENVVSAIVPDRLKRVPSQEPFNPQTDIAEELGFEQMEIKQQEYLTPDGFKVVVTPVLQKVFRYSKYNQYGEPAYSVNIQPLPNIEKVGSAPSGNVATPPT